MKKILLILIGLVLIATAVLVLYTVYAQRDRPVGFYDAEYIVAGKKVSLVDGMNTTEAAITRYFGNRIALDLNKDGREDSAFIITQETGSSTLYFLVARLDTGKGSLGSEAVLLGDRIAPQTTERGPGTSIIVNYAVRKQGESFAVAPSVGKSMRLILDPQTLQFGEVAQNFEGEADPNKMVLSQQPWEWIRTTYNDGKIVTPKKQNVFSLTFTSSKTFSATTDCNGIGGEYSVKKNTISFERMVSTLMFCEDSQEQAFSKMISEIQSYHFTSKGELVFDLKMDSGSIIFR